MDSLSVRQAPPSLLFEPPTYLRVCAKSFRDFETNGAPTSPSPTLVRDFLGNPVILELTKAANAIEPAIDLVAMEHGPAGSNLDADLRRGAAYYRACKLIGADRFTDVVLLPFVTRGGGERYISNVLNGIGDLNPDSRFLILGGQWLDQHDWLDQLPRNATFIDLPRLGDKLSPDDIDVLTLRLIEATAPTARVHLKTSAYAHSFFQRYGRLLACNRFIYYRFSDPAVELDGQYFVRGDAFDFLSENGDALDRVISDHQQIVLHDRARLEPAGSKWTALYTRRDPLITREAIEARGSHFTRKLLWAARLDKEKRPELLLKIARALEEYLPEVSIDVFGSPVMNAFDVGRFASHPNIHYRGSYDSFSGLDHQGYDALLYTSLYDGLPNVVLEALAAGLPVIAPDLGGIGEAVATGSTGFLIPRGGADAELVSLYANAVSYLYQHPELFVGMRLNALQAVLDRHAAAAFEKKLAEILEQLATDRDRG
jgi:glycosyltransferase involved in cell wall biosynthesis